ncbi:LysR family transcriptional regulator [Streptococcus merionis]|uniref:LysR family transcriptional regulator n=1 Tax=Streptococcus merionis TaxID=400065 RepID=A0A239SYX5_9STRE|nr:LysR family transcriptional regulator [Streptococcus merionis]SNU89773.1 LysR family transcriptional regulator [Streptococcus merionis]
MIETRLFHYFLAIARERNITRAAEQLFVTQSTLSKQMQDLEKQLGKQLFIRGKRQITLTEEGEFFRSKAQEILQLVEQTEIALSGEEEILAGDIYIAAAEVPSMAKIVQTLKSIQDAHPNLRYHIISGDAEQALNQIRSGVVDIGLLLNPPLFEDLDYQELPFSHTFGLILPKEHPLAQKKAIHPEDLVDLPLITSQQFLKEPARIQHFGHLIERLNVVASYNLLYNAIFMVKAELGLLMALEDMVELKDTTLVFRPFDPAIDNQLYMVSKKHKHPSLGVKLVMQELRELTNDCK